VQDIQLILIIGGISLSLFFSLPVSISLFLALEKEREREREKKRERERDKERERETFPSFQFELCWRTQQPSLTVHPVDGSRFGLWPLFHLRDGGKWTEMTATHGGALRH
jgi:hypothetical protein